MNIQRKGMADMQKHPILLFLLVALTFGTVACDTAATSGDLTTVKAALRSPCEGITGLQNTIYVTMNGSPNGDGTLSDPYDLPTALQEAAASGDRIGICQGAYLLDEEIIDDDVEILGVGSPYVGIVSTRPGEWSAIGLDAGATITFIGVTLMGSADYEIVDDMTSVTLGNDTVALPNFSPW